MVFKNRELRGIFRMKRAEVIQWWGEKNPSAAS
jgi:hypothetical protein